MKSCDDWIVEAMQARGLDLPEMAASAFEHALRMEPEDGSIRLELARCYYEAGKIEQGAEMMHSLGGTNGADGEFLIEMGKVWMLGGQREEAALCFQAVNPGEPEYAQALIEEVLLLVRSSKTDLAGQIVERRAEKAGISGVLARAVVLEAEANFSGAIELHERICRGKPQSQLQIESGYRYARLLAKEGEMVKALAILKQCKLVEKRLMAGKNLEKACHTRRVYDLALLDSVDDGWFRDRCRINEAEGYILLGHPRSGTSLLAKRISAAAGLGWVDESPVFDSLAREWVSVYSEAASPQGLSSILRDYRGNRGLQDKYLSRQRAYLSGKKQPVLDKNPGLSSSFVSLHALLPDIAWIVALRDPRDVAMSCYFQRLGDTMLGWSCLTPEGALNAVNHVFKIWARVRELLPAESFFEIRYESFVENEAEVMANILASLGGISHSGHYAIGPQINLTPSYEDIRKETYQSAVKRWEQAGDLFAVNDREWEPLLESFGFEA